MDQSHFQTDWPILYWCLRAVATAPGARAAGPVDTPTATTSTTSLTPAAPTSPTSCKMGNLPNSDVCIFYIFQVLGGYPRRRGGEEEAVAAGGNYGAGAAGMEGETGRTQEEGGDVPGKGGAVGLTRWC